MAPMTTGPGEPAVEAWRTMPLIEFGLELFDRSGDGDRLVVAVDGRSGGGKSTLAHRLRQICTDCAVVAVDDVGWHAPMFGWQGLLADGILRPFRDGARVRYRPPAWDTHARSGAIEVPDDARILLVEGVGASSLPLTPWLDVTVWIQSDYAEAERRGIARDISSGVNGDESASIAFWHDWMRQEDLFLAADRPWQRADVVIAGTSREVLPPELVRVASIQTGHASV